MARPYYVLKDGQIVRSRTAGRFGGWRPGKIFGRLTCCGSKKMFPENRVFFLTWDDAIAAGFRPCLVCKPQPNDRYVRRNGRWILRTP